MEKLNYTDMLAYLGIGNAHPGGSILTKAIFSKQQLQSNMKVLEVGCGTGKTTAWLAKNYQCQLTAIEPHDVMHEKAFSRFKKLNLQVDLRKDHVEKMTFSNDTFDLIIAESVIAFTDTKKAIAELSRVLKKGGKLISIDMVAEKKLSDYELAEIQTSYGITAVKTEKQWQQLYLSSGFSSIEIEKDNVKRGNEGIIEENEPSSYIDPQLFTILQAHTELLQKYKDRLGYRIFYAIN